MRFFYLSILFSLLAVSCQQTYVLQQEGALLETTAPVRELPSEQQLGLAAVKHTEEALLPRAYTPGMAFSGTQDIASWDDLYVPDTTVTEEDTTKEEPVLHPLVLAGASVTGAAVVSGVIIGLTAINLFFIPVILLAAGAALTTIGYKQVKIDPEKYKGEKLALAVYYALVPIGLFAMLLPVWWLLNI
jgi:hypothetical protein